MLILVARRLLHPGVVPALLIALLAFASNRPAQAQNKLPDHIRGQIASVDDGAIEVRGKDGVQRIRMTNQATIISLSPGSFTDVDFGVYVGSVSEKLDDRYSPIYRDSLSWLHKGLELRIIDEKLRGIALGHMEWDLTPVSVMTHGWVDDMEIRVISIKYGPTEAEETDVEIGRDLQVLKMALGSRELLTPGANVFIGASRDGDGQYTAAFVMVGTGGIKPGL